MNDEEKLKEENLKTGLELYKILNTKIDGETKELYLVNTAFLVVNGGLMAFIANTIKGGHLITLLIISIVGLLISFLWARAILGQILWKNFWANKLITIEEWLDETLNKGDEEIKESLSVWAYLRNTRKEAMWKEEVFEDKMDDFKGRGIWQELKKIRKEKIGFGLTRYIKFISWIFIFAWLILSSYFLTSFLFSFKNAGSYMVAFLITIIFFGLIIIVFSGLLFWAFNKFEKPFDEIIKRF